MWVKKTPEELIWGYHEGLFDLAELGGFPVPPNGVFGFFTKVGISYHLSHTIRITYFKCYMEKSIMFELYLSNAEKRHRQSPTLHNVHWRR